MPARKLGTQCAHVVVTADTAEAFEATNWEEPHFLPAMEVLFKLRLK